MNYRMQTSSIWRYAMSASLAAGLHQQGWNPGDPYYNLPYSRADIADLLPYAYRKQ